MDKHVITNEEKKKLKVDYVKLYHDGIITNPKVMDLQDRYVFLNNEVKNTNIVLECKDIWYKMSKSKYEGLLYNLICDAEKDLFTLNAELNSVIDHMMQIGRQSGR